MLLQVTRLMNYYLTIINGRKNTDLSYDMQLMTKLFLVRGSLETYILTQVLDLSAPMVESFIYGADTFFSQEPFTTSLRYDLPSFSNLLTGGYVNTSYLIKGQILMFKSQYFWPKFRHKTESHKTISDFPIYLLEHPKTHQDLLLQIKEASQRSCQQLAFGKKM